MILAAKQINWLELLRLGGRLRNNVYFRTNSCSNSINGIRFFLCCNLAGEKKPEKEIGENGGWEWMNVYGKIGYCQAGISIEKNESAGVYRKQIL